MSTDRRRAAATATVGAGATYAGGVLRHQGVRAAWGGEPPSWKVRHPLATHPTRALMRTGAKGRRRYLLGASLGLIGAPALAVGGHDYVVRKSIKRATIFVGQGADKHGALTYGRVDDQLGRELPRVAPGFKYREEGETRQYAEFSRRVRSRPARVLGSYEIKRVGGGNRKELASGQLSRYRPLMERKRIKIGAGALVGTSVLAAGAHHKNVRKRDDRTSFVNEGLRGTQDALEQRVASAKETPPQHKLGPIAVATGAGALGSLTAHRGMDRLKLFQGGRHHAGRAGLAATAGTAMAAASLPLSRHTVRDNDYEVTPAGVRRRKTPLVRPSTKGQMIDQSKLSRREFRRQTVGKVHNPHNLVATTSRGTTRKVHWRRDDEDHAICGLDGAFGRGTGPFAEHYGEVTCNGCARLMNIAKADYRGRNTSHRLQGAAILAAGTTPVVGPLAAAHQAARFAPPGEGHHAAGTQYVGTTGGGAVGGIAGAYGLARLADHNPRVQHTAERALAQHTRMTNKVTSLKPVAMARAKMPRGGVRTARLKASVGESKLARPLRRNPVAAAVGYYAGSKLGSYAGSGAAMRHNFREQDRYNLKHPVVKYVDNMTTLERRKLSRKKRYAAASSTTTGVLGLGALAARAKKKPEVALNLLTGSAAIGGVNNLNFAGVLRREAKATDPHAQKVTKGILVAKADRREPLTRMHADTAAQIVRQHGDAGPLPNHLSRDERMQAYEARYVHAGGHKAEHWQHRADLADRIKTGGLAGATAGGVGIMALRSPRLARALGPRLERARHAVDSATIGAATVSGAGELYAGHARRRRSSYSNSKAGVAASALRRMRDYSS